VIAWVTSLARITLWPWDLLIWGVGKEAARSRNRWYIAWSAHRHRSALALQTAPSVANDQCRDQQQQSRLRLMTPFLPHRLLVTQLAAAHQRITHLEQTTGQRSGDASDCCAGHP
jgi:hypothetical protein